MGRPSKWSPEFRDEASEYKAVAVAFRKRRLAVRLRSAWQSGPSAGAWTSRDFP